MTSLNNIYIGNGTSSHPSTKTHCLVDGIVYQVANGHLGWYPKIQYRFIDQLTAMLSRYKCVMVVRADLRLGGYSEDNKIMTVFLRRLKKHLKRKYTDLEMGHLWVREQEKAKQQHYHIVLMVDKNLIHYSNTITEAVIYVWQRLQNSQAHIPKRPYYSVKQGDNDSIQQVLKRVSYLAKSRGKGYKNAQTKNFGSSRIKAI